MSARKDLGIGVENLAAKYLESLGYTILERNFRYRLGEIDIVAEYEGHLVICEVKSRSSGKTDPSLSATLAKRTKLRRLCEVFIAEHPNKLKMQPCFDVISIIFQKTMLQSWSIFLMPSEGEKWRTINLHSSESAKRSNARQEIALSAHP